MGRVRLEEQCRSWDGQIFVTSYAQIERWWEMVMSAFAGQPPHKFVASAPTPTINTTRCSASSNRVQTCNIQTGIQVETGVEQFALGDSALGDLKFAQTWLNLFPIPRLSASLFDCVDESLPR